MGCLKTACVMCLQMTGESFGDSGWIFNTCLRQKKIEDFHSGDCSLCSSFNLLTQQICHVNNSSTQVKLWWFNSDQNVLLNLSEYFQCLNLTKILLHGDSLVCVSCCYVATVMMLFWGDYLFCHLSVRILDFHREYNKHKALASVSREAKELGMWLQGSYLMCFSDLVMSYAEMLTLQHLFSVDQYYIM